MYNLVYASALEGVASGLTHVETLDALRDLYPNAAQATVKRATDDALDDALKQGVEREDIDPSWFRAREDDWHNYLDDSALDES